MPYCPRCGTFLDPTNNFCPSCGIRCGEEEPSGTTGGLRPLFGREEEEPDYFSMKNLSMMCFAWGILVMAYAVTVILMADDPLSSPLWFTTRCMYLASGILALLAYKFSYEGENYNACIKCCILSSLCAVPGIIPMFVGFGVTFGFSRVKGEFAVHRG